MERSTRRIHLGIDYGTSWSKIVLRDYEAPEGDVSWVVAPSDPEGDRPPLRFPSIVAMNEGRLWFGWEAERRRKSQGASTFTSLKVRMALPDAFRGRPVELPQDLDARDLATLTVAYLVEESERAATNYAKQIHATPKLSMTIGAPMAELNSKVLRDQFANLAREAFSIVRSRACVLRDGLLLEDAKRLLATARDELSGVPVRDHRVWVRSEVEAALLWPFRSPGVGTGLYAAVDVGAGTTDASFFRITEEHVDGRWQKRGLAIFGAASGPPGVDAIDAALARPGEDPASLRMRENERLSSQGVDASVLEALREIRATYQRAFGRAYEKDKRSAAWFPYGLFAFGGGAQIHQLRDGLEQRAWKQLDGDPELIQLSVPHDLHVKGDRGLLADGSFLVAYGLSFFRADVPQARTPDEVKPFDPKAFAADDSEVDALDRPRNRRTCPCGGSNWDCSFCGGCGWIEERPRFVPPAPTKVAPMASDQKRCKFCKFRGTPEELARHTDERHRCPRCGGLAASHVLYRHVRSCGSRAASADQQIESVTNSSTRRGRQAGRKKKGAATLGHVPRPVLVTCEICSAEVAPRNLEKHMRRVHDARASSRQPGQGGYGHHWEQPANNSAPNAPRKSGVPRARRRFRWMCPKCGARIRRTMKEKHELICRAPAKNEGSGNDP
jgi:hypothetical protein